MKMQDSSFSVNFVRIIEKKNHRKELSIIWHGKVQNLTVHHMTEIFMIRLYVIKSMMQ